MEIPDVSWPRDLDEARSVQGSLSGGVMLRPLPGPVKLVAGIDAAFTEKSTVAAVVVLDIERMEKVEETFSIMETGFPYIPGYLSFREGPAVLSALKKLRVVPDVFIFDGQGIAHPRGLGIATHIGVLLGRPTIGCAKSRLVGEFRAPRPEKGAAEPLMLGGTVVGVVLRTRSRVKPLFVSPGNLVTVEDAAGVVLECSTKYRLPEPVRYADRYAAEVKKRLYGERPAGHGRTSERLQ